jgi:hypothetical protein
MRKIMHIKTLTRFFLWCTIIDGAVLLLWTTLCILTPDLVYHMQNRWFPIPREIYNVVIYSFLGLFKIAVLLFNVVPYVALLIIGRKERL